MEKGRLMLRSLLVAAAVLVASIPVAAQQQLWSATMTTGEIVFGSGTTYIGYYDLTPINGSSQPKAGELSDIDFDFRGTTYTIWYWFQQGNGNMSLAFSPPLDGQALDPLTFTADGHSLALSDRTNAIALGDRGVQIFLPDPGFRWTAGQRIALGLTATARTPPGVPAPARPGRPSVMPGDGTLELSWPAVPGADSYPVQWRSGRLPYAESRQQTVDTPSATLTGLTNGMEYTVRVRASNAGGDSAWSEESSGTPMTPVPALPMAGVGLLGVLLARLGWRLRGGAPEPPGGLL